MSEPNLGSSRTDIVVSALKGSVGALPYVGGIVGEIIGNVIPNQRIDRIAAFVKTLDEKVASLDQAVLQPRMLREEFVDLFEDATMQASRALSSDRREYLASLLKNSLANEELEHIQEKRLLQVLGELNDAEVIILQSYSHEMGFDKAFREKHEAVLRAPLTYIGAPQEDIDRGAVYETFRANLQRQGLIKPTFRSIKKGEVPEFDVSTGMIKPSGWQLTGLGRLLLRYLDLTSKPAP